MPYSTTYSSPLGTIVIESEGEALTGLRFADDRLTEKMQSESLKTPIVKEARQWLDEYFAGKEPQNVPRISPKGTDFQKKVWQALLAIPYGQTKTYGEIAKMVGCHAPQAVGQAVGSNPIALMIPCHRVVGANGAIGGYAFGIERKRQLLEREKTNDK